MQCAPGTIGIEIFALTAVGVVNAAVQYQLLGAAFDIGQRHFTEKGDRIVI